MYIITVGANEDGQRLDRFLKKYLRAAPLSLIYRLIRKDVKVDGARVGIDYMLHAGEEIGLYLSDERVTELTGESAADKRARLKRGTGAKAKRKFGVAYEDEHILVVSKPYGLLTHGDKVEKKETLVNQVTGYLLERGEYDPGAERMFTPSPVNRLDRNTSGLVVFGKDSKAIRDFSKMIAETDCVEKYYLTVVSGMLNKPLVLKDRILKDEEKNKVAVLPEQGETGKAAETHVKPVEQFGRYTLVEVRLVTGRTHQIRAHLAEAGYPVIGDTKYGDPKVNRRTEKEFGLTSQFLHANRLKVIRGRNTLEYLSGEEFESPLPKRLADICETLRKVSRT
jgi:23S rRNA pseudouridine955/2504/2580 synthase